MVHWHAGYGYFSSLECSDDVLAGAPPESLFACREMKLVFASWECDTKEGNEVVSADAARTFFCPVCSTSRLTLGGATVARCGKCGWEAKEAGVNTVSDLLARDAEPWPDVAARVGELVKLMSDPGASFDMASVESKREDEVVLQDHDEDDTQAVAEQEPAAPSPQPPPIVLDGRVRRRGHMPPRRQLPRNEPIVISPYTRNVLAGVKWTQPNASKVLPKVTVLRVFHDCEMGEESEVIAVLEIHNTTEESVTFECTGMKAWVTVRKNEKVQVEGKTKGRYVRHGQALMCTVVGTLFCTVGGGWRYAMHVWHSLAVLREEG